MGSGKNKRRKAAESCGGSPARKRGVVAEKVMSSKEKNCGGTMECGETCCESEANNNMEVKRKEREDMKIAMASKEMIEAMECGEHSVNEENSEGQVISEEDRRSTIKSTTSLSSEVSEEENIRRQIREDNLKKHRMVRTRGGLKYDVDVTEEDRKSMR